MSIHHKAVKHGHVLLVKDWPHSTFHKYVTQGLVDENWGGADEKGCLVSNLVKWCANKS